MLNEVLYTGDTNYFENVTGTPEKMYNISKLLKESIFITTTLNAMSTLLSSSKEDLIDTDITHKNSGYNQGFTEAKKAEYTSNPGNTFKDGLTWYPEDESFKMLLPFNLDNKQKKYTKIKLTGQFTKKDKSKEKGTVINTIVSNSSGIPSPENDGTNLFLNKLYNLLHGKKENPSDETTSPLIKIRYNINVIRPLRDKDTNTDLTLFKGVRENIDKLVLDKTLFETLKGFCEISDDDTPSRNTTA
jgi:hypothetical protein